MSRTYRRKSGHQEAQFYPEQMEEIYNRFLARGMKYYDAEWVKKRIAVCHHRASLWSHDCGTKKWISPAIKGNTKHASRRKVRLRWRHHARAIMRDDDHDVPDLERQTRGEIWHWD